MAGTKEFKKVLKETIRLWGQAVEEELLNDLDSDVALGTLLLASIPNQKPTSLRNPFWSFP
jgi:hypothetical protein